MERNRALSHRSRQLAADLVALADDIDRAPCPSAGPVVLLSSHEAIVNGKRKPVTTAQHAVVGALLDAGDAGLSLDELCRKSGGRDARNILKRLAQDPDWKAVITMAGRPWRRYRLATAPTPAHTNPLFTHAPERKSA